jgi:hypothetical protein
MVGAGIGPNLPEGSDPVSLARDLVTRHQRIVQDISTDGFARLTHQDFPAGGPGALCLNCLDI